MVDADRAAGGVEALVGEGRDEDGVELIGRLVEPLDAVSGRHDDEDVDLEQEAAAHLHARSPHSRTA